MRRPKNDSQAGRILRLLENGGKVPLPAILALQISQYSARIHDLRHSFGFKIENGSDPGRPDHTWLRLVTSGSNDHKVRLLPKGDQLEGLFTKSELERTA